MSLETVMEDNKLVLRRTFAAPIELVYQAWTDPNRMVRWFAPNIRWNSSVIDIESKVGGRHNIMMRHTDGDEIQVIGKYQELVPNERISFTWSGAEQVDILPASVVTVEFRTVPEGTEITLTHDRHADPTPLEAFASGWSGMFEMLESYLGGTSPFEA